MTDYREIEALKRNPDRARSLAEILSGMKDFEWTDWESDFLENIAHRHDDLTTRQGEKLVELREQTVWYKTVDGFNVRLLVENCYRNRDLLEDESAAFVASLRDGGTTQVRRRQAKWLMSCARTAGVIEPYQGRSLELPKLKEDVD